MFILLDSVNIEFLEICNKYLYFLEMKKNRFVVFKICCWDSSLKC